MGYDPFARGPHPVGVSTAEPVGVARDRCVPTEVWYPATSDYAGADLDPEEQDRFRSIPNGPESVQSAVRNAERADGRHPLVMFSHGFAGHRRQTSHFCSHLASHGYVVAAVDHVGNTVADVMSQASSASSGGIDPVKMLISAMADRPQDVSFAIDRLLAGEAGISADGFADTGVGMSGHSFGGWTTLRVSAEDDRIAAAIPMAPAGGKSPLGDGSAVLEDALRVASPRAIPTLFIAAEFDTLLPLDGIAELYRKQPAPKQLVTLHDSDHMHFCDRVEETHDVFRMMGGVLLTGLASESSDGSRIDAMLDASKPSSELCPGVDAYALLQGLGVLQMDAHLRKDDRARDLLAGDLVALLAGRGVSIDAESSL